MVRPSLRPSPTTRIRRAFGMDPGAGRQFGLVEAPLVAQAWRPGWAGTGLDGGVGDRRRLVGAHLQHLVRDHGDFVRRRWRAINRRLMERQRLQAPVPAPDGVLAAAELHQPRRRPATSGASCRIAPWFRASAPAAGRTRPPSRSTAPRRWQRWPRRPASPPRQNRATRRRLAGVSKAAAFDEEAKPPAPFLPYFVQVVVLSRAQANS